MSNLAKFPTTKNYDCDKIYESDVPLLKETSDEDTERNSSKSANKTTYFGINNNNFGEDKNLSDGGLNSLKSNNDNNLINSKNEEESPYNSVMNAQMTTIETVTVVRPLKVISLICLIVSLILLILSLVTTYWLKTHSFHTGLFEECVDDISGASLNPIPFGPAPGKCQNPSKNYVFTTIVAVLMLIAAASTLFALLVNALGLKSDDLHRKFIFYKIATYFSLLSVFCELSSLVGFPIVFFFSMNEYGVRNWEFDWSYGVAWGAMLFAFGASLLLICDKEHEEVYHKEKTIYNPPSEFA